ncbi:hypothetical protein A7D27_22595 [Pseudomonas sp. 1D4]|nr:hypothetical protein A7D27_22595 [Pseudomonas sp. 1D4]OEC60937.1 hypothetical protein A9G05_05650 [Pseudomonas sp. ENNP23]
MPVTPSAEGTRVDPWKPDEATRPLRFAVHAAAEADLLLRLLGHFAQLQVLPLRVEARHLDDDLRIEVVLTDLPLHRAEVIARRLRGQVGILGVELQVTG